MIRIGILAGGGRLPLTIAESVVARGESVHIVAIEGEADPEIARFPHTWVNWGQIGRMVATLRAKADRLVIAGGVKRPDLRRIRPDVGFFMSLPQILSLLAGGDDSVLTRVVRFFEAKGLSVCGVHDVAPDLLAGAGRLGGVALRREDEADAGLGFAVRQALGVIDAGQAVVVARGKVLAIEGAEGTDAMLQRVAALPGPRELTAAARRARKRPQARPGVARRHAGDRAAHDRASRVLPGWPAWWWRPGPCWSSIVTKPFVPPMPPAAPSMASSPEPSARKRKVGAAIGRVIGRLRPSRRDAADIETGLAAVTALAPFATGASAVVVRRYVLAIEAAEGIMAMLERAATAAAMGFALAQGRRAGAPGRGAEAGIERARGACWRRPPSQGLAGIAVTGRAAALAPYEEAALRADNHGLFLVLCEV